MKKSGANAAWFGLSVEGRAQVEEWLFEERINYAVALERAQKELGFKGSLSSLKRFYQRIRKERMLEDFAAAMAEKREGVEVSSERMQSAGMKLAAQLFLKQIAEQPENPKEWGFLAKLLLQQRDIAVREKLKTEENAIRQRALDFAKHRFQFDTLKAARRALPELLKLDSEEVDERKTPQERRLEENKRINDCRRAIFACPIPDLFPETPEEEANPEIIKKRSEAEVKVYLAECARQDAERKAEWAGKAQEEEDKKKLAATATPSVETVEEKPAEPQPEPDEELSEEEREIKERKAREKRERDETISRLMRERERRGPIREIWMW